MHNSVKNQWVGNYYLGADGKMLKNTTTPDGYRVGSDGAWIPVTSTATGTYRFQMCDPQNFYGVNTGVEYFKIEDGKLKVSGYSLAEDYFSSQSAHVVDEWAINSNTAFEFNVADSDEDVARWAPVSAERFNELAKGKNYFIVDVVVENGVVKRMRNGGA